MLSADSLLLWAFLQACFAAVCSHFFAVSRSNCLFLSLQIAFIELFKSRFIVRCDSSAVNSCQSAGLTFTEYEASFRWEHQSSACFIFTAAFCWISRGCRAMPFQSGVADRGIAHSQMVQRRLKKLSDRLWCADKLVQRVGRNEGQQLAALSEIWLWNLASCDWVCVLNDTCTTNQQDTCLTDTTNASISPKILWLDVHFYAQHCGCRSAHSFQQKSEIFFLFFGKKPKNRWIQIKHVRKPLRVNYSI